MKIVICIILLWYIAIDELHAQIDTSRMSREEKKLYQEVRVQSQNISPEMKKSKGLRMLYSPHKKTKYVTLSEMNAYRKLTNATYSVLLLEDTSGCTKRSILFTQWIVRTKVLRVEIYHNTGSPLFTMRYMQMDTTTRKETIRAYFSWLYDGTILDGEMLEDGIPKQYVCVSCSTDTFALKRYYYKHELSARCYAIDILPEPPVLQTIYVPCEVSLSALCDEKKRYFQGIFDTLSQEK